MNELSDYRIWCMKHTTNSHSLCVCRMCDWCFHAQGNNHIICRVYVLDCFFFRNFLTAVKISKLLTVPFLAFQMHIPLLSNLNLDFVWTLCVYAFLMLLFDSYRKMPIILNCMLKVEYVINEVSFSKWL